MALSGVPITSEKRLAASFNLASVLLFPSLARRGAQASAAASVNEIHRIFSW